MENSDQDIAYVHEVQHCDFCKPENTTPATYDGKTKYGSWAFMCDIHFKLYGCGLGLGRGQKLELYSK